MTGERNLETLAAGIIAGAPDAILYIDKAGIIHVWNASCERIFGFTTAEAVGQPLDIIIPANLRERHHKGHAETMRTGHTKYGSGDLLSVPALRKDGTRISVEFSIIPFRDAGGAITGMAAIMRDVTKRFEEMKALRKAAASATGATRGQA
jgi:PAS domain S-box-containing protein